MLRRHNNQIPVRVYLIDTEPVDDSLVQEFVTYCQNNNVSIIRRPLISTSEDGYFHVQRLHFQEVQEPSALFIDSDTFIYGDVERLFDRYKDFDFVAGPNTYFGKVKTQKLELRPFCAGVMLFNNGWMPKWAAEVVRYCCEIREERHPIHTWLPTVCAEPLGVREEIAATLFVGDNGLKYAYFEPGECTTEDGLFNSRPIIFHCFTCRWLMYSKRLQSRVPRILV